jgi:uncharacterized protein with ATP-grasp and redox domains
MKTNLDCVPCLLRQAREAIALSGIETGRGLEILRQVLRLMAQLDWTRPPPVLSQQLHRRIRQLTGSPDPYAAVKERMNQRATELYPTWHRLFRKTYPSLEALSLPTRYDA